MIGAAAGKAGTPYATEREIEDIDALIKANGGSSHLFGLSSGAILALQATAAGLNVNKVALYEPPYTTETMGTQFPVAAKEVAQLVAENKRGKAVDYFSKMVGAPKIARFIMRLMPIWPKLESVAHTLPYDLTIIGDGQVPRQLASSIKTPMLVIVGAKSPVTLQQPSEQLAKALPNAQFKVLEGQAHNVSMKALSPMLIAFLKK